MPPDLREPTQQQCEAMRGDTPCSRCGCELRLHVWGFGTVGACRLHQEASCPRFAVTIQKRPGRLSVAAIQSLRVPQSKFGYGNPEVYAAFAADVKRSRDHG
jgi:hypothetical protein